MSEIPFFVAEALFGFTIGIIIRILLKIRLSSIAIVSMLVMFPLSFWGDLMIYPSSVVQQYGWLLLVGNFSVALLMFDGYALLDGYYDRHPKKDRADLPYQKELQSTVSES